MSRGKCIKPRATKRSESTLRGLVLVLVLAALLVPVAGWADIIPIQLTSGTLTLTGITPTGFWTHQALDVFAPDLAVHFTTGLGALGPGRCEPCFPGVVNSTSGDNSETVSGTATFHGVTNQVVGAGLSVTGSLFTMPLLILPSFFVVLPFTLHVQFCPNGSTSCATGIDASGSGQSEFHYDRHPVAGQPDGWRLTSGVYTIQSVAAVPEPTTLALTGTALALVGLAWLAHKKKKAHRQHALPVGTAGAH